MTCDCSGDAAFCMHHLQDAFDALEAVKARYPDPVSAVGFTSDSVLSAVEEITRDVEANCERMNIPFRVAAGSCFIDGLMMGVLLAARAPKNHAEHVLAELS